jgi:hypothetical protein
MVDKGSWLQFGARSYRLLIRHHHRFIKSTIRGDIACPAYDIADYVLKQKS